MSRDTDSRIWIPAAVTGANIVTGFLAMVAASDGRFELAVYLLLAAIMLDVCDGRVARMLNATSKFGQELDSFSDALSFCAAPSFLVYQAFLKPLGDLGLAISAGYLLAGIFRLARFNLTADAHVKARRTVGVPTPIGAGYLMALTLMRDEIPLWIAAGVVVLFGFLLVSRWKLPQLSTGRWLGISLLIGVLNFFAVVLMPNWYTVIWWNLWNVVILISGRIDRRRHESPSVAAAG